MANNDFFNDPFGSDMNDIFNNMMGNMNGMNSENRRYLINGREVTPEEFVQYRQTGNYHKVFKQPMLQTVSQ